MSAGVTGIPAGSTAGMRTRLDVDYGQLVYDERQLIDDDHRQLIDDDHRSNNRRRR